MVLTTHLGGVGGGGTSISSGVTFGMVEHGLAQLALRILSSVSIFKAPG